jgi:hypothetical protein
VIEATETNNRTRPGTGRLAWLGRFLFWAIAFGVAFTQWPLYSENQHTKFLHGLASSGYGFLRTDWLANTLDPLPAFSWLVSATYRLLPQGAFYLYHVLLLGIYIYSIVGIAGYGHPLLRSGLGRMLLSVILIALHAGLLPPFSITVLGTSLGWLLQSGVASQYLINPAFQPSTFGVLLILSIYLFLSGKRNWAAASAALAAVFHSTYLPSAAILTASYMMLASLPDATGAEQSRGQRVRSALELGAVALAIVMPVLVYNLALLGPTSAEAWRRSQDIIVHFRIPQHSLPEVWVDDTVWVKLAIVVVAAWLTRRTRLFSILLLPLLAAVVLTLVQVLRPNDTLAFVAPWRMSVFLVPLSSCMVIASVLSPLIKRLARLPSQINLLVGVVAAVVLGVLVAQGTRAIQSSLHARRQDVRRPMLSYVRQAAAEGQTYLVPTYMAEFRLETGAPVVVTFKSHPYKDVEVIEWQERVLAANDLYSQPTCDKLLALRARYSFTHVVVESSQLNGGCTFAEQVYGDGQYTVYRLREIP